MLNDAHIIRFYGRRENGHFEFIFLEYASGGELFDRIGKLYLYIFIGLYFILLIYQFLFRTGCGYAANGGTALL